MSGEKLLRDDDEFRSARRENEDGTRKGKEWRCPIRGATKGQTKYISKIVEKEAKMHEVGREIFQAGKAKVGMQRDRCRAGPSNQVSKEPKTGHLDARQGKKPGKSWGGSNTTVKENVPTDFKGEMGERGTHSVKKTMNRKIPEGQLAVA